MTIDDSFTRFVAPAAPDRVNAELRTSALLAQAWKIFSLMPACWSWAKPPMDSAARKMASRMRA